MGIMDTLKNIVAKPSQPAQQSSNGSQFGIAPPANRFQNQQPQSSYSNVTPSAGGGGGSSGSSGSSSYGGGSYPDENGRVQAPETAALIQQNLAQRESSVASATELFQQNLAQRGQSQQGNISQQTLQQLGLTPLTSSSGQITGYEDRIAQMSYKAENLPQIVQQYRPQDTQRFVDAGLLYTQQIEQPSPVESSQILPGQYIPTGPEYKPIGFFERGVQTIGVPFTNEFRPVTGTLEFLGTEAAKRVQQQPVAFSDILPYKVRGTASNFMPQMNLQNLPTETIILPYQTKGTTGYTPTLIGSLTSPSNLISISPRQLVSSEEFKLIQERKTEAAKAGAKQTVESAPFIVGGILGMGVPAIAYGTSGLLTLGGVEQYVSKKGREKLAESAKVIGPIAYGLPAVEIGLGAYGVTQGFKAAQLEALRAAKPEIQLVKSFQMDDKIYLQAIAEQRIPSPGFSYKPIPFGKETISPRITTPMVAKLTPTDSGGFIFRGGAITKASILNPLTGNYAKLVSQPYPIFGTVTPGKGASLVNPSLKLRVGPIEDSFVGKTTVVIGKPGSKDFFSIEKFGGFPIGEKGGVSRVVSGPIDKLRLYPGEGTYRAVMNPKTLGLIAPETETTKTFTILPRGTKAQLSLQFEKPTTSIADLFPELFTKTRLETSVIPSNLAKGMVQSVGRLSGQQFAIPTGLPLVKFPDLTKSQIKIYTLDIPQSSMETITKGVTKFVQLPSSTIETSIPKTLMFSTPITKVSQELITIPKQIPKMFSAPILTPLPYNIVPRGIPPGLPPLKLGGEIPTTRFIKSPKQIKPGQFTVEFRRRGKFFPIAQTKDIGFGVAIGKKAARQTLGASFRVKSPTGAVIPLRPTQEFRLGKGAGILVQRATTRLTSGYERREIAQSRRQAGYTIYPKGGKNIFGFAKVTKGVKPFTL